MLCLQQRKVLAILTDVVDSELRHPSVDIYVNDDAVIDVVALPLGMSCCYGNTTCRNVQLQLQLR